MRKLKFIFRYFGYLLKSQNQYMIHSPFVYNFVSNVIYKKTANESTAEIESLRNALYNDNRKINMTDFGAGSNINSSKKRKIKDIAKNSSKNKKFGQLLFRIVEHFKPKVIFELGTSLGISTLYLAKGNNNAKITTFEGCKETANIAKENFNFLNFKKIETVLGNFKDTYEKKAEEYKKLDLIFVDGNHQEKATINYFETLINYSHNKTIIIFDDIHWSIGMENAWKYIKDSKKTSLTIDLFFIGIVFLDPKLSKENYIIRF